MILIQETLRFTTKSGKVQWRMNQTFDTAASAKLWIHRRRKRAELLGRQAEYKAWVVGAELSVTDLMATDQK